jgi:hypothetical protein
MKIGTRVRLTKRAVKRFYGTSKNGDMYFTFEPTLKQLLEAVNNYEFDRGLSTGIFLRYSDGLGTSVISWKGVLGTTSVSYIDRVDLEKVK